MKALLMLICGSCCWAHPVFSQETAPFFKHLTVEEGLSNNWVKAILKDKDGFMWFGTFKGLNRYDGRSFKVFEADTVNQLQDNLIEALAADSSGHIWVGTFSGGLYRFDRKTEVFDAFKHDPADPKSISGNKVQAIYTDRSGQLWIGTDGGLDKFVPASQDFVHVESTKFSSNQVTAILEDSKGALWVGTDQGLGRSKDAGESWTYFSQTSQHATSLAHDHITSLYEDKYGDIWIGTWGGGLDRFATNTQQFIHHRHDGREPFSLRNNSVLSVSGDGDNQIFVATEGGGLNIWNMLEKRFRVLLPEITNSRSINSNSVHALNYDKENGLLWVGTYNGGINYFSKWDKPFIRYQARLNGLNNKHVTSITSDQNNRLWIGTDGGGLNVLDLNTGDFSFYRKEEKGQNGLQSDAILSLLCDRQNNIWVGTFNGGLDLLPAGQNDFSHFALKPSTPTSLSGKNVSAIYEDKRGNIWVGTMTGGLNLFHPENGTFTRFQHDPRDAGSIIDNFIYGIMEDRKGRLLVQTGKGLEILDYPNNRFSRFNESLTTDFDVPVSLLEDSQGYLWVGSQEKGLFRVDRTGVEVRHFTMRDGLPGNSIAGILEDDFGNLWISTDKGLCKYEEAITKPEKISFHIYSVEDGLQGSEFKRGAAHKLADGRMAFGGQNGFNLFDPLAIKKNPFIPAVRITGFKLFNKEVDFRKSKLLNAPVSETRRIELNYDQSVFTLEFAALNFMLSEKNKYAYMMEGFEDSWNEVGTQNQATYTNLDPGKYTFSVKAANNDGIWNEAGTSLEIIILPPWWDNPYVKAISLIALLILVSGIFWLRTYQLARSKKILAHKVALRTADLKQKTAEVRELNEAKIRFFTNISHELRTPLNLILWPLEEMLQQKSTDVDSLHKRHQLMYKNARRLIHLINQLLDFRKMETGSMQLHLQQGDMVEAIREYVEDFEDWANQKQIDYQFETQVERLTMAFDADKLHKIMTNLLSNAFKFVGEQGRIEVHIDHLQKEPISGREMIQFSVQDNGPGIKQEEIARIFDRFYEGQNAGFPGSGIGLSLVKKLVDLHEGKIGVESRVGNGTCFLVQLPTDLKATEISDGQIDAALIQNQIFMPSEQASLAAPQASAQTTTILLVEDNPDILHFMQEQLASSYQVLTAQHGRQALALAQEQRIDLIISDVMMPEMDGFELTQQLKQSELTSHIPILLLTARSGEESQLRGFQIGADDYITKPFSFPLLQLKINNILYTRQQLREQLGQGNLPAENGLSAADQQFLLQAAETVRENLHNSAFGVEDFSESFGMSRRNVLRKMKGLTGLSINEYIRNMRLKEAHRLLKEGELNVSEVAYTVGYSDPKYFSNSFKKQFGKSPSEVRG